MRPPCTVHATASLLGSKTKSNAVRSVRELGNCEKVGP